LGVTGYLLGGGGHAEGKTRGRLTAVKVNT